MTLELALVGLSTLLSLGAVARTFARRRMSLAQLATLACDHGEHAETRTVPRWKLAHEAGVRLDLADNGKRDYTDAQLRIAIDAEAKARGWVRQ